MAEKEREERLEINVNDRQKLVQIWLTNAEKTDSRLQADLQLIYTGYKEKKYTVAVFYSGEQELYPSVRDLLIYNKRRCSELAVQRPNMLTAER